MMRELFLAASLILLLACSAHSPYSEPDGPPDRLEKAAAYAEAHAGDALVVWERGEVVLERAQNGFDLDEPHVLFSGTKSFAGIAAVAAAADGQLALDERVAETIPKWQDDPKKSDVTIRHLLHLTSGLDPGEAGGAPTFEAALQASGLDAPGTTFRYGPTAFQVFGALLQRTLDGEDPLPTTNAVCSRPSVWRWGAGPTSTERTHSSGVAPSSPRGTGSGWGASFSTTDGGTASRYCPPASSTR
jgi:CubicO group peptidase (beta-lactamase class C family)